MERSENLKLYLPSGEDFYNIEDFNNNSKIIDRKIAEIEKKVDTSSGNVDSVVTEKIEESERKLNETINTKEDVLKKQIEAEAKKNFENLYGLVHKTVTISADRIVETGGGVTATTAINRGSRETTFVTSIEKGAKRYTKTERIRKTESGTTVEISYREER